MFVLLLMGILHRAALADVLTEDVEFLNELPLDKLLRLKSSLNYLATADSDNVIVTTPASVQRFGGEAMYIKGPAAIKRGDYEETYYKKESKISNIFSMSVTTLAFLAFGGYLLCLIVQAVKAKQNYQSSYPGAQPTTFFVSAGLKKKPQAQFASYGRRKRENRTKRSLQKLDLPPERLFEALLQLCEGYAKWSDKVDAAE
ncbi:uncharacterized protein LOC110385572 [Bombyx mori]|uniref:Uncharacterized protein n=1 Tax=Bombyx mori TaxID=7091 RepID=A0A8R2HNG6_BOMMO|nr:uncharacterized protein LOC110385572 [Bombyx mori]